MLLGAVHAGLFALASLRSKSPMLPAFEVTAAFWICFGVVAILALRFFPSHTDESGDKVGKVGFEKLIHPMASVRTLSVLLVISAIGLMLHMYSKYALTEIRPVSCLFDIRFAWQEVPHKLQPFAVRLSSMAGHVLTHMALPSLIISGWALSSNICAPASRPALLGFFISSISIGLIYAGFLGSRNAMLTFLITSAFGVILGLCSKTLSRKSIVRAMALCLVPAILGGMFATAVFSDRMFCESSSVSAEERSIGYLKGFEDEIPVEVVDPVPGTLKYWVLNACPICNPAILYLNHGMLNLAQVIDTDLRGQPVLAQKIWWVVKRLGLSELEQDDMTPVSRVYGKGGLPLAGSAYHDFGWAGMFGLASLFGLLVGFSLRGLFRSRIEAGVSLVILTCSFYILSMSYMFTATGVMFFPFLLFSTVVVFGLIPLLQRSKSYKPRNRND